jgi:hypothetical protein
MNYRDGMGLCTGIGVLIIFPFELWVEWLLLPATGAKKL